MNNIDSYKEYIQDSIINHLERLMGNDVGDDVNLWEKYGSKGLTPQKDSIYRSMLHAMMVPYYKMYLNGDTRLCCAGSKLESIGREMAHVIAEDDQFGSWASEQDLITSAEGWGDNMKHFEKESKRIYRYFHVLELLLQSGCQQDWKRLSGELKEMLFKAEVCYDYKTDEVLCILHAFTMIMQQEWTKEKKQEQFHLLYNQWLFLKHYYSVMTRHIIGVKWTSFRKVAETVMSASQSFKPHLHIFYCGLMDCVDELHLERARQRRMDKVILQMQEELNRCEPSELLYELCNTLFPEDFQRLLREHRPKSYKEVEDESHLKDELIEQMQAQTKLLHKQLDKTEETLQQMVLSSIPIERVDDELMKYPPGMAWDMLGNLNANPAISVQPAWREHFPTLLEKYRKRLYEPIDQQKNLTEAMWKVAKRPTYGEYHNYQSGSTHDDKRSQLLLGEEKENYVPLKQLTNE
jgi:hypothetical protein